MRKGFVLYLLTEALLAALFVAVVLSQGLNTVAYWALAGIFAVNLVFGIALLTKPRKEK